MELSHEGCASAFSKKYTVPKLASPKAKPLATLAVLIRLSGNTR